MNPSTLLRALQISNVLLTGGPRQYRHQLPAIGTPLVEDLFGGVRQQRNRDVLPCCRLAHDASLSVGHERLCPAWWQPTDLVGRTHPISGGHPNGGLAWGGG